MFDDAATEGPNGAKVVTLVAVGAAILSALVAFLVEPQTAGHMGPGMGPGSRQSPGLFLDVRMFLSTYSVLLLVALTWSYVRMYRRLPNRFTVSLVLFTTALFLYAISSNPAVHLLFGFRGGPTLGPFVFIPDLFAALAVTILLYQSYQ
jgi:hypothetical protein